MKVYLEASEVIKSAFAENLSDVEFTNKSEADIVIDEIPNNLFKISQLTNLVNNPSTKPKIIIGDLEISIAKKTAAYKGKQIYLTEKELQIIEFFTKSDNGLTREDILEEVWGYSPDTNTRTVETHLHRLNNKFMDEFNFKIIESTDKGYVLSDT